MKKSICLILFTVVFLPAVYAQEQTRVSTQASMTYMEGLSPGEKMPDLPKGPLLLTSTTPEQLTPDYWINRLPEPDKALKTPEQLKFFNQEIHMMIRERVDIFKPGALASGTQIREIVKAEYDTISNRKLFNIDDRYIPKSFFTEKIMSLVNWEAIPSKLVPKWGVATRATSIRALPTNVKMLEEKGDIEFDQLQFTLIKTWTPVAVLHTTKDGQWYYVQAPYVRGWVKAKHIAIFPTKKALQDIVKRDRFLDVTGESVAICVDPLCREIYDRPSMGTILPSYRKTETHYMVEMPIRSSSGSVRLQEYYINRKSDVHEGFPAFTQRNIIQQTFKLLGQRYGWGGMYYGRDCSGFVHDVFLSMGVDLPRDSDQQALVGTQLGHFEPYADHDLRESALSVATPGIALFKMPMHQMIYLGQVDGKHFIIHSTWAERISMTSDEKNRINQVIVSDLSLNGRSYLGSLQDRIVSINELD